jgi:pimeloyl-ACP methyl ester carboxylesterase
VQFLRSAAGAFRELNRSLDLVSFDPRGVGGSTPAVRCHDDLDDTIDVLGPGGLTEERLAARIEDDKRRCSTSDPALLAHVGTNAAARDLDWLRAALGDEKLTYLGFSYGTRLGSVYAELFPSRVRAMALDGADEPSQAVSRSIGAQFSAFEGSFRRFQAWCDDPASGACPTSAAGGVEATFRAVERRLRESGPLDAAPGPRRLTLGELYLGVIAALYSEANWPRLGSALADAAAGDGTALQRFVDNLLDRHPDGSYANTIDANVAINCADDPERPTFDDALARGRQLAMGLPFLGPLAETAFMDCVGWAAPAQPVAVPSGHSDVGVLVIGTTGDPATPYPWAAELARALVSARLLTYRGEGHTAYFASPCVRAAVDRYLTTLVLPEGGDC